MNNFGSRSAVETQEIACFDGLIQPASQACVPVTDDGFLRGDGVFEVVRVYKGEPFALPEHLDRLEYSARNLRLGYDVPRQTLTEETQALLENRGESFDGLVRMVLTRGNHRLLLTEPPADRTQGVRLGFVTYAPTRVLDGVKSLSYAANMLASRVARERGFDEALLVTPHGRVLEAPTASIFWVGQDGALSTPPLGEHILASITRDRLMRLVEVQERVLTTEELLNAREAFLTSTTREAQPVAAVETHELDVQGPQTKHAAHRLREHIQGCVG
jgi:branched-subunit amino acid aminotransferase/4-amino-4-deoxychorismate lyase